MGHSFACVKGEIMTNLTPIKIITPTGLEVDLMTLIYGCSGYRQGAGSITSWVNDAGTRGTYMGSSSIGPGAYVFLHSTIGYQFIGIVNRYYNGDIYVDLAKSDIKLTTNSNITWTYSLT